MPAVQQIIVPFSVECFIEDCYYILKLIKKEYSGKLDFLIL